MKKLLNIFIVALVLGSVASCKKALEEEVYDFRDPENFYKTDAELLQGVNGVYKNLMTWNLYISPAWSAVIGEDDDLFLENWIGGGYTGNQNGQWYIQRPWNGYYYVVQRANLVLKYAETVTGDTAMISRIKGEAFFLRGFCYSEIAMRFGDAPIRTQAYDPTQSKDIARSPRADVYKQSVADLQMAAVLLPANFTSGKYTDNDHGRPTKAAALGLLSKVYMHLAGNELKLTEYYKDAVAAAKAVRDQSIATGFPALESDYMAVFNQATQDRSKEMLFSVPATNAPNQGPELPGYFSPSGLYAGGGSNGFVSLRTDFYKTFQAGDKRVAFGTAMWDTWTDLGNNTLYHISQLPAGSTLTSEGTWGGEYDGGGGYGQNTYKLGTQTIYGSPRYYCKKYIDASAQAKDENGNNPIILRYADVLLILAEAENEVNGASALAYDCIDEVRLRAGLDVLPAGLSQGEMRDSIRLERRHELYGEFQRRFDLVRWGTWLDVMKAAGRPRLQYQLLYPLSQEEIAGNKLIPINNPGY
jgi:hypothetical protein